MTQTLHQNTFKLKHEIKLLVINMHKVLAKIHLGCMCYQERQDLCKSHVR